MPVLYALAGILLVYLVFCFFPAIVMFRKIFYLRGPDPKPEPEPQKSYYAPYQAIRDRAAALLRSLPATEVSITSHDGIALKADRYPGTNGRMAILVHGYRSTPMTNCAYLAARLWEQGYDVLTVHQRAHGKSGGRISTLGQREQKDVLAWIRWAAAQSGIQAIALYGVSMGAAAVAYASDQIGEPKVRAMVLDCGFTSSYDQMLHDSQAKHIPSWTVLPPIRLFYRLRFHGDLKKPVTDALSETKIPALFLHGTADGSVPLAQGQRNFAACASPKEALFQEGADHTCVLLAGGEPAFKTLSDFLNKHLEEE